MVVTATEFKTNSGKYLELIAKEDDLLRVMGKWLLKLYIPKALPLILFVDC